MVSGDQSSREPLRPEEALRQLQERLDRASSAAERLMAEAVQASGAGGAPRATGPAGSAAHEPPPDGSAAHEPPPAGWQAPASEGSAAPDGDLDALVLVLRSLRDLIPPDLQQRLIEALREVLQAIRALIDWYLERLEHSRSEPAEVEDIPIL